MLMCYPMFSALTGFVLATLAPRYWRSLYGLAAAAWVSSIFLMWTVVQDTIFAPAIYGGLASLLGVVLGLKLRKLSREGTSSGAVELSTTVDFPG